MFFVLIVSLLSSVPPRHLKMLNVDESALTNPAEARFGGLTRDHNDKFSKGYYCRIGYANIFVGK